MRFLSDVIPGRWQGLRGTERRAGDQGTGPGRLELILLFATFVKVRESRKGARRVILVGVSKASYYWWHPSTPGLFWSWQVLVRCAKSVFGGLEPWVVCSRLGRLAGNANASKKALASSFRWQREDLAKVDGHGRVWEPSGSLRKS